MTLENESSHVVGHPDSGIECWQADTGNGQTFRVARVAVTVFSSRAATLYYFFSSQSNSIEYYYSRSELRSA